MEASYTPSIIFTDEQRARLKRAGARLGRRDGAFVVFRSCTNVPCDGWIVVDEADHTPQQIVDRLENVTCLCEKCRRSVSRIHAAPKSTSGNGGSGSRRRTRKATRTPRQRKPSKKQLIEGLKREYKLAVEANDRAWIEVVLMQLSRMGERLGKVA